MPIRRIVIAGIALMLQALPAFSECGGDCGTGNKFNVEFHAFGEARVLPEGSITVSMKVGGVGGVESTKTGSNGEEIVVTPERGLEIIGQQGATNEDGNANPALTGSLSITVSNPSETYGTGSGSMAEGTFVVEGACGWVLEMRQPDVSTEWKEASSIKVPDGSTTTNFQLRLRKKAGQGQGTNPESGALPPSIPEDQQDSASPTITPAGFESGVPLGDVEGSSGFNTGELYLSGAISPLLADVSKIKVLDPDGNALKIVRVAGNVRQVTNFRRLADLQPVSGGGFEIRMYDSGTFGTTLVSGLYPINSGASPYLTVAYTPVAANSPDHLGGVRVTQTRPSQPARQSDILATMGDGTAWRVVSEGGLSTRDSVSNFLLVGGQWQRTDIATETRGGVLYAKSERVHVYQFRRAGSPAVMVENHEFLLEERIHNAGTTVLTTTWEPDPVFLGKAKSVTRPDGSWSAYTYYDGTETAGNYSWKGLLKETLEPWNGSPATPSTATSTNSRCTVAEYGVPDSSQTGLGDGIRVLKRTTTVPGCTNPIRQWFGSSSFYNVASLVWLLENSGLDSRWNPGTADIEVNGGRTKASSSEELTTWSLSYKDTVVPGSPWLGSSFASLDEEGNGSVTGYERGTFNSSDNSFTANDPAATTGLGTDTRSITVKLMNGDIPEANEGTREISIRDSSGKTLRSELWILTELDYPNVWSMASVTTYEYPALWPDGTPKETIVKHDGRVVSRTVMDSITQTTTWDEQGIETISVSDLLGRTVSVTRVGAGGQPDIVTSYGYSGRTTTTTTSAGGHSRTTTSAEDLSGRTVSETDASGAVTTTTYPNGGRDTLTTQPGGLTRLVTRNIDGQTVSVTGSAVVDEVYSYGVLASGNLVTTRKVGDLSNSPRYSVTEQDWAGRTARVTTPSPTGSGEVDTVREYYFRTSRLASSTSPAGVQLQTQPDWYSSLTLSGYDVDASGDLETYTMDRVTETLTHYVSASGFWWEESVSKAYDVNDSDASAVTSSSRRCLHGNPSGLASWAVSTLPAGGTVTSQTTIDRTTQTLTQTEITSGVSTNAVSVNVNGLLISQKGHDATIPTRWDYDAFGQPIREISPRGAITRKDYYADGSLATATDHAGQTTTYAYYASNTAAAGKLATVTNPQGKTTTYSYSDLGQVTEEAGTAAYRVTYEYDAYGATKKMFTWRDGSTADPTEWIYQDGTGLLLAKKDAALKSTTYTYNAAGKTATRTWARGAVATYSYNDFGDLAGIVYSGGTAADDATSDVTLSDYDRLGRPTSVTQAGVGTETLTYHQGLGAQNARFYTSGHSLLPGIGIRNSAPDALGRTSGFVETAGSDGTAVRTIAYAYDSVTGNLGSITDGTQSHTYAYHPDSALVSTINSNTGGTSWFRESRYYDTPGRLLGIRSDRMTGSTLTAEISSHGYDYDSLNRRTKNTFQDGSFWEYGYNDRSEVTSATRKTSTGIEVTPLAAAYTYDGIGNRLTSTSPALGDHTYTPNSLNQYATLTTGNSRTAVGRAPATWTVQVAGTNASRIGELYYRALTATNTSVPVWQSVITKHDTGTPTMTNNFWYAKTPTAPSYDDDGNLTNDGRWAYSWDAENRLIQMETTTAATGAGHPYTKLQFAYDWQGHRIARHVWQGGTAGSPTFKSSHRWLYDGWNVIAEFSAGSETGTPSRLNTFTWGLDLSGTLQGAGGVGGLLVQTTVSGGVIERASYDGNGNIVAWTKSNATAPTSRREYDAFGNTLVSEGAAPCAFGFSTKMQDAETGLYYYGYRFYDPVTGRWPSRDPIGEEGGVNLYGFAGNVGINEIDVLGLIVEIHPDTFQEVDGIFGRRHKYLGSRNPVRHKEFAESILKALKAIVGDCAQLNLEISGKRKVKVPAGLNDPGWKKYKVGDVIEVPIYRVSYSREKNNCKCDSCWQQLKKAIDMKKKLTVYWDDITNNASGGPNTYINPNLSVDLPEVDDVSRIVPFSIVLWHELIGHGLMDVYHQRIPKNTKSTWDGEYYDPTIKFENMGRECLRRQGDPIKDRVHYYY